MPDRELRVIGDGPEFESLKRRAPANVRMLGYQSPAELNEQLGRAKAFVFAAEEDFGIVLLEAQACGTPVIAYGRGGALETIVPNETGLLFHKQTAEAICETIAMFEERSDDFNPERIRAHAARFAPAKFREQFFDEIVSTWAASGRDTKLISRFAGQPETEVAEGEETVPGPIEPGVGKKLPVPIKAYPGKFAKLVAAVRAAIF
jgi:hypothetical protein